MLPSVAFNRGWEKVKFQLPHCRMLCTACHMFGTTRSWTVDPSYKCQLFYNVKYTPLKDVLKDAGFRDLMKLAKDDEFRYGGLIPKVSAKGLEIIVYAKTRFLLSDLVTWTWDKRTKMSLGRYFLVSQEINSFS